MTAVTSPPLDIGACIDRFVEVFNENDLDGVMTFFADHAVYRPGDGKEHRGVAEIREAFRPQFSGEFGIMRFDEHDRLVDREARKIAIRWVCRHDLNDVRVKNPAQWLQWFFVGVTVGKQFGWEGIDVFHLDEMGKITSKNTYANYKRPQLRQNLGTKLQPVRFLE